MKVGTEAPEASRMRGTGAVSRGLLYPLTGSGRMIFKEWKDKSK